MGNYIQIIYEVINGTKNGLSFIVHKKTVNLKNKMSTIFNTQPCPERAQAIAQGTAL